MLPEYLLTCGERISILAVYPLTGSLGTAMSAVKQREETYTVARNGQTAGKAASSAQGRHRKEFSSLVKGIMARYPKTIARLAE